MTTADVTSMKERIVRFEKLSEKAFGLRQVLAALDEPKVHGSGPFTGNHRESRRIDALTVHCSPTRGGSPPCVLNLKGLDLSAWEFGEWLENALRSELNQTQQEIEKL